MWKNNVLYLIVGVAIAFLDGCHDPVSLLAETIFWPFVILGWIISFIFALVGPVFMMICVILFLLVIFKLITNF